MFHEYKKKLFFFSAISEGRGMARGEIGMAAIDLRHPHMVLCQFSDTLLYTHTLTKINYFNPIEVYYSLFLLNKLFNMSLIKIIFLEQ